MLKSKFVSKLTPSVDKILKSWYNTLRLLDEAYESNSNVAAGLRQEAAQHQTEADRALKLASKLRTLLDD